MATRLTQERVDKWNQGPANRRLTTFRILNAAWRLVEPKPLLRAGKIVLDKPNEQNSPRVKHELSQGTKSLVEPVK